MRIHFWGTRGSLPVAMTAAEMQRKLVAAVAGARGLALDTEQKVRAYVDQLGWSVSGTFGGHSSCVQLDPGGEEFLLCDVGSGARPFGVQAVKQRMGRPATYHLLVSHLHWDHIMGFPFFTPAWVPGNRVRIYGGHAELEAAFRRQQEPPSFPVPLSMMRADIQFTVLAPGKPVDIAGCRVVAQPQHHSGDSYSYRVEHGGRSVVYSTDAEHKLDDYAHTQKVVEFFRDADLVIFDSMYSLADTMSVKEDWGHSSNVVGVELCQMARARRLCLFHHEPIYDDQALASIYQETRRLEEITREGHAVEIITAYDGLEIDL